MLDPVYYTVSAVMRFWYEAFGLVLGHASGAAWVLSVVFLVLTLRALMIKPTLVQIRAGQRLRALAPLLAELRRRHADDPVRLATQTRALRTEHGVGALGGLLPALLQLPVFIGLLHVLNSFSRPGLSFEQNAALPNYVFGQAEVRSFLEARLFGAPLSAYLSQPRELLDAAGAHVDRWEIAVVAVPLALVAAVATHFSTRHSVAQQAADGQAAQIMRWMPWIFPVGVLLGAAFFPFPIAILAYWLTSNVWTLVQQWIVLRWSDSRSGRLAVADTEPAGLVGPGRGIPPPRSDKASVGRETVQVPAPRSGRVAGSGGPRRRPARRGRRRRRR